jgi:hypothetical protein
MDTGFSCEAEMLAKDFYSQIRNAAFPLPSQPRSDFRHLHLD